MSQNAWDSAVTPGPRTRAWTTTMVIQLYTASKTLANDDAGTQITKSTLAPVPPKYPYPVPEHRPFRHVPSLSLLCLLSLYAACPDQLSLLNGLRLNLRQQNDPSEFDLIQALVPDFDPNTFQSTQLDPRLWVSLAQVYDNLPQVLRTYHIPLSDEHLLLLQRVQSTPTFSLITIVNLTGCVRLTDETIIQLKQLRSLVALDASSTSVSDNGIKALAGTIFWSEDDASYRGPSSLRILRLRSCKRVTDNVLHIIPRFPLLCLVGTSISSMFTLI
ncbi:hypothetical protein ONZ45_g17597 [Pleurotus djamor]|nr:hypothetical protein ONZ45_g17597 [Pleurotus djamor]